MKTTTTLAIALAIAAGAIPGGAMAQDPIKPDPTTPPPVVVPLIPLPEDDPLYRAVYPITPDLPTEYRLRTQLAKERTAHRLEAKRLRARVKALKNTLRRGPDFDVSVQLAAIAYGQSASHLRACALSEGYGVSRRYHRRNLVTNLEGSGATSSFQFMRGTFLSTPYAAMDWHRQDVQAHAAAWMWSVGRRGEWAGKGC